MSEKATHHAIAQIVCAFIPKMVAPTTIDLCDLIESIGASFKKVEDPIDVLERGRDVWERRHDDPDEEEEEDEEE